MTNGSVMGIWEKTTSDPVALYTLCVGIFTLTLTGSTIALWWTTRRSVQVAERALTELERPYLYVLDYNWLLAEKAKAHGHKCGVGYSVVNAGKLPASIKAVKLGLRFGASQSAPRVAHSTS